jgi:hypothetical protein
MAAAPGVSPGIKTQRRSGGCSANVPGRDVAAARARLQGHQDAVAAAVPMSPGMTWHRCTHGCSARASPGVEMQQRSGGCSTNVPRRDVAVAHIWLQRRAFYQALRHSGTVAAAAPMSPGVMWWQCTHGCSTGLRQASRCSGAALVATPMSPGVRWWWRAHGCTARRFLPGIEAQQLFAAALLEKQKVSGVAGFW